MKVFVIKNSTFLSRMISEDKFDMSAAFQFTGAYDGVWTYRGVTKEFSQCVITVTEKREKQHVLTKN